MTRLNDTAPAVPFVGGDGSAAGTKRKLTIVLDMDETIVHTKWLSGDSERLDSYRQQEDRPERTKMCHAIDSFIVGLEEGDYAQVNKRPGLDKFLEVLARDYNTVVYTAALPDYAEPVLDVLDPECKLFNRRYYRNSCQQSKGAFLKDLTSILAEGEDLSRVVLIDNNPLSFLCQPTNGILVTSFYDDVEDVALASLLQLIRYVDGADDVRPVLREMFKLDLLLVDYRAAILPLDDEEQDGQCIDDVGVVDVEVEIDVDVDVDESDTGATE